jgi:hypothetical protein
MSGAGRRTVKAADHPVAVAARQQAANKGLCASDPPAKPAPKSPQSKGKKKSTGAGCAAADNAREDALSEALDMVESVAVNDEGNNKTTPPASPPHVPRKADRTVALELNKEKAERAKLQAETERLNLKKELDNLVKEKKRRESVAAEPAPPGTC